MILLRYARAVAPSTRTTCGEDQTGGLGNETQRLPGPMITRPDSIPATGPT